MDKVLIGLFAFVIVIVIALFTAIPVYFLWNAVVPDIFGLPVISFWEALGLSILSSCLFKNNN